MRIVVAVDDCGDLISAYTESDEPEPGTPPDLHVTRVRYAEGCGAFVQEHSFTVPTPCRENAA